MPPKLSPPVHYLFPHFHLNILILYPTDTFNFYPSELPYLAIKLQFTPSSAFSLLQITSDLPPTFSVPLHHGVLHFYFKILIFYHGDSLKFYPPDLPTCPQQFPQFTSGCSCSLLEMTSHFTPSIFPTCPILITSFLPQNRSSFFYRLTRIL